MTTNFGIEIPPTSIELRLPGEGPPLLRADESGQVWVRGELVDDNREIYVAFKSWLEGLCPNCKK
jgi:hypothetical protein